MLFGAAVKPFPLTTVIWAAVPTVAVAVKMAWIPLTAAVMESVPGVVPRLQAILATPLAFVTTCW